MNKDIVIKAEGIYKKFSRSLKRSMLYGSTDVARSMLGVPYSTETLRKGEFWSLQDINFELKKGDALGIIGQNGSGKTTLLRIINGIFPPDKGRISIKGSIGALIAVGAGFHPHMTGRENIYLNGTILGMSQAEIKRNFDSIIEFADIGDFMDAPVATYSSGMTVRLGFSIAIHSMPEILLADEVLAVGDLAFALKCYRKISEYRQNGGSIILVSHGMSLIRNTCNKVLWLDKGSTKDYGDTQKICDDYESFMMRKDSASLQGEELGTKIINDPLTSIKNVEFLDKNLSVQTEYKTGEEFRVRLHYDCRRRVDNPIFSVTFATPENIVVVCNFTNLDGFKIKNIEGKGYIDLIIDKLFLKASQYRCSITFAENNDMNNILEWHDKYYSFNINPNGIITYGLANPFPRWNLVELK